MSCSRPRAHKSTYCETHLQSHASRMVKKRQGLVVEERCIDCWHAAASGHARCPDHLDQQRRYYSRVNHLTPDERRKYAHFCSACGQFQTAMDECGSCTGARTGSIEYSWHEMLKSYAQRDNLWPPTASTFFERRALGTSTCPDERLMYPDVLYCLGDRVVVCELDEHSHESNEPVCELARLDSLQFGVHCEVLKPIVVLRMNPHCPETKTVRDDMADRVLWFYQQGLRYYLQCPVEILEPVEMVRVVYFDYEVDSPHIAATRAQARFLVEENIFDFDE